MFAIYAETDNYQYLVTSHTASGGVTKLLKDVDEQGERLKDLYSVFAIDNNVEDKYIQEHIAHLIKMDSEK